MYPINPTGTRYGKRSGKRWASNTSQAALRDIREKALEDLKSRDEKVSGGRLSEDNGYQPYELEAEDPGRKGEDPINRHYVINSELVRKRHKGSEFTALVKSRWAAFCAEPRDETQLNPLSITRNRVIAKNIEEGQAVEATLGLVGEAETVTTGEPAAVVTVDSKPNIPPSPPKRRGRPPGSKNRRTPKTG